MGETLNNYKSDADDTHMGKVSTFDSTPPVTSKMQPLNTILKEGWQDVESQKSIIDYSAYLAQSLNHAEYGHWLMHNVLVTGFQWCKLMKHEQPNHVTCVHFPQIAWVNQQNMQHWH